MTPRRVRFTETARHHVRRESDWWLQNRDHTDVFADELEAALRVVASLPGAGTLYTVGDVPGLRRLYVPKVACHLYYTFDDREVLVRLTLPISGGALPFQEARRRHRRPLHRLVRRS